MSMTIDEALTAAKAYIARILEATPEQKVGIYLWPTDPNVGIRVAEVSVSTGSAGASWMQSDLPHGLVVCAQVERVLLEYVGGGDDLDLELCQLEVAFGPKED